jgi:hypothetical protein
MKINYKVQSYLIYFIVAMWLYIVVKISLYFSLPDFFWIFNATYWTTVYLYQKHIPYIEIKDHLLIKNIGYP